MTSLDSLAEPTTGRVTPLTAVPPRGPCESNIASQNLLLALQLSQRSVGDDSGVHLLPGSMKQGYTSGKASQGMAGNRSLVFCCSSYLLVHLEDVDVH